MAAWPQPPQWATSCSRLWRLSPIWSVRARLRHRPRTTPPPRDQLLGLPLQPAKTYAFKVVLLLACGVQDEIFHVPQTQRYCARRWAEWDEKITTFPGLYLLGVSLAGIVSPAAAALGLQVGDFLLHVVYRCGWVQGHVQCLCWSAAEDSSYSPACQVQPLNASRRSSRWTPAAQRCCGPCAPCLRLPVPLCCTLWLGRRTRGGASARRCCW